MTSHRVHGVIPSNSRLGHEMPLKKLGFTNLGPFDDIEFEFDEHVNVLTGPNNSGKSTALMALGEIAVFPFGIPEKLLRSEPTEFKIELFDSGSAFAGRMPLYRHFNDEEQSYEGQMECYSGLLKEIGYSTFVPAIRRSTDFRAEAPTVNKRRFADDGHDPAASSGRRRPHRDPVAEFFRTNDEFHKRRRLIETDASSIDDEAVVQSIVDLDYRAYRRDSPDIRKIIEMTATIASEITEGYSIHFERVEEDDAGLFPQFSTPDGAFPLDVLSQGTQSLIQWISHLLIGLAEYYNYPPDVEKRSGVLIIDEIDAHLHPSWQRRVIPKLTEYLPKLQIFCSTHSPLMLAGLRSGQVQLLDRDVDRKVTVSRNEQDIIGWSADEILRSFLDVESPTDLKTLENIERLQELQQLDELSEQDAAELERLRKTVNRDLVGGPLAAELDQLRHILNEAKTGIDPAPNN